MKQNRARPISISPTAPQVQNPMARDPLAHIAGALEGMVLLGLVVTFLLSSLSYARADDGPVTMSAACDGAVAVFSVQNKGAMWRERGTVTLIDSATGKTLRERRLAFGERQTATFRLPGDANPSGRVRLSVYSADGMVTYVKSFTGHCAA